MMAWRRWRPWLLRGLGAVLLVGGFTVSSSLGEWHVQHQGALVFWALFVIAGALALLARGLGPRTGLLLGLGTGLVAAVVLAPQSYATLGNALAFGVIATAAIGFVGHLAGKLARGANLPDLATAEELFSRQRIFACPSLLEHGVPIDRAARLSQAPAGPVFGGTGLRDASRRSPERAEEVLGATLTDFAAWVESEPGRRCCSSPDGWAEFETFVQALLERRLGAAGVRVYWVSSGGERLEPLKREALPPQQRPHARAGLIGHVLSTGRVFVAGDPDQREFVSEPGRVPLLQGKGGGEARAPDWTWLLPLRAEQRTAALVAAERMERAACRGPALARAVRGELELFLAHVGSLQALARHARCDVQSGLLNRAELLAQLDAAARQAAEAHEPLVVLALAVEGLRGLDDAGRWVDRDAAVLRIGTVLRQQVRNGDLLGRFNDDRFVVVLRGLESGLGTLVAEKLMKAVRTEVLDLPEVLPGSVMGLSGDAGATPRVRAGLAGLAPRAIVEGAAAPDGASLATPVALPGGEQATEGKALLRRALCLLEYARQQRIDVATDLMKGLPESLAGGACGPGRVAGGVNQ